MYALRRVKAPLRASVGRRWYADWNTMAEAFVEPVALKLVALKPVALKTVTKIGEEKPKKLNEAATSLSLALGGVTLNDVPPMTPDFKLINWSESFHGLGLSPFDDKIQKILLEPLDAEDIEITPDGLLYLPEIKYRRVLNRSFGAGGWGLAPRSETVVNKTGFGGTLTREYALICQGRLIGIARGEQDFFSDKGIPTASEGCKSNALMRCCKDLGIASELWDPKFIRTFKKKYCEEVFVEHIVNKKKKKIWKRKDGFVEYPFKKT